MEKIEKISIVVPVFNEFENLPYLNERLFKVMNSLGFPFEIIYVDDGSSDGTENRIKELHDADNRANGVILSRNFGHQIALTAGLENANGNVIVTLDGDLQHPPEVIPELVAAYQKGFDVVNTARQEHQTISAFKKYSSKLFYKLFNTFANLEIEPSSSDFRLCSRRFLDAFLKLEEKDRFIRGMVKWVGFPQTTIPFKADERLKGVSKYNFKKMLMFSINGITSFSSKPLRIPIFFGIMFCIISVIYSIYILYGVMTNKTTPGWSSTIFMVMFIGGVQLLSFGIIAEYILRIFNESKKRPLYIVKEKIE
jgi:dolichol-phosphate mannosyltransferase